MSRIKPNTAKDIQFSIHKIEKGSFDHIIIKSLLIDIRDFLPFNSAIKELAHFIAHPSRNKGTAFNHLNVFINNFLNAVKFGGKFSVNSVYKKTEIVKSLMVCLKELGFIINEQLFSSKESELIDSISFLIEDSELELDNKDISEAKIVRSNGDLVFSFYVDPKVKGKIRFHENVSICIPFWD